MNPSPALYSSAESLARERVPDAEVSHNGAACYSALRPRVVESDAWREIQMPKEYYSATGPKTCEWVDSPEKVDRKDYKETAEATLRKLRSAELVEIRAKSPQEISTWVVSVDK